MDLTRYSPRSGPAKGLLLRVVILANCICLPQISHAFHLPLWELGAGLGVLTAPHYRGSKKEVDIMLPFPYAIYRGDVLRIDQDEGVRGKLFERENINLDLSLAGSIPVPDTDDGARTGMDSLDPLVEAGAQLKIGLWNSKARGIDKKIEFAIPYRAVFSVGYPILEFQGWTLSP